MRQPLVYTVVQLRNWNVATERNGKYIPARPEGHNLHPLLHRWKAAIKVLLGKLDAVDWEEMKP